MIIDQQKLIEYSNNTCNQKEITCKLEYRFDQGKKELKFNFIKRKNWSYNKEELTKRIIMVFSNLQTNEQIIGKFIKKKDNYTKVISREILYFKVMKLVINYFFYS